MPRGGKKNANQHNNRHENGIVAPGKRITKQKSNGHLNGSPNGRSRANTPPPPTPLSPQPITHSTDNATNGTLVGAKDYASGHHRDDDQGRGSADGILDDLEDLDTGKSYASKMHGQTPRKIDVNAAKPNFASEHNTMNLTLTILKSCPLRDTLAILIFLLSLPPTFLTLTNTVFMFLTLVPPSGSFSGFPTFSDITQGSLGAVSFTTMCIIDCVGVGIWLILLTPLRSLTTDWAQAMVATTLGGGYSNRPGGSDRTLLCMSIVSASHLSRYKRLLLRLIHRTWFGRWIIIPEWWLNAPMAPIPSTMPGPVAFGWFSHFIALHIVSQGLARLVRRWLLTKRDNAQPVVSTKPVDSDAAVGFHSHTDSSVHVEPIPPNSPTELMTKASLSNLREVREKISTGKKKRKQGNLVRSQQPLWAAFAATKATILREYEQSQATTDALGSNATDVSNLGSAPFVLEDGRIWVTLIQPSSFFFDTSFFPDQQPLGPDGDDRSHFIDETGIDRSKPFYVRINGANWTSAKIQINYNCDEDRSDGQQWMGEVYGLSPAYTYQVCFVRCEDDVVIHSETVATPCSPLTDPDSSNVLATSIPTIRPSSPTSPTMTLKNSIAAYEASLLETSSQQRRIRKDSKLASGNIKRDLESLKERMQRVGSNDKGQQNRQLQQSQYMRQADDAIASITDELVIYDNMPEEDDQGWRQEKAAWDSKRSEQSAVRHELIRAKDANHRDSTTIQAEALTATQKRERLQHRIAKLSDQFDRLRSSTQQGAFQKELHHSEQSMRANERLRVERNYLEQIHSLQRTFQESNYRARNFWLQIQALETAREQQSLIANHTSLNGSRPITPEGELPGTHSVSTNHALYRFPAFGTPDSQVISNGHAIGFRGDESNRARSTSVLSGNSVYTDFSDQDPAPPMPTRSMVIAGALAMRQNSSSSGSGSPGLWNDGTTKIG